MGQSRNDRITSVLERAHVPEYQVQSVWDAIYKKGITSFSQITTLPLSIREQLKETVSDPVIRLKPLHVIDTPQVMKVLLETQSKDRIEAVRMHYNTPDSEEGRYSLCVSSQSGCALACTFCATGAIGFKKNLEVDEIVDQVLYFLQKKLPIDTIVFMGMGEPFANPNVFEALNMLTNPSFMGISQRRISVSTVGLTKGIERLSKEYSQINLAFSLHSPFPEQRLSLMPITKVYPIDMVFASLREHIIRTKRKVFIAYILLAGENDSREHAKALADLIRSQGEYTYLFHVNLIRYHPGPTEVQYKRPAIEAVRQFQEVLNQAGIHNTLRQSVGIDVDAACGQLYAQYEKK